VIPKRQTNNLTGTNLPELDRLIDQFRASSDAEEMRQLTHRAQEIINDDAAFIPGFRIPGYRVAHWPWLRFPEGFDVRSSDEPIVAGLYWLDPARREQDLANFRTGKKLGPPVNRVLDRWRTD
jgi:microcin C transport system substrate-binding protein